MGAVVALVGARGTTAVTVSDIAEAADVSRQLVYQQFGDRDTLLLEAALDLAERELMPRITEGRLSGRERVVAAARHFAEYRSYYRAMLTGPVAYALAKALNDLLSPLNQRLVHRMSDQRLSPELVEDLTGFLVGGSAAVFNRWVVEGPDLLDPEPFADRLLQVLSVIADRRQPTSTDLDKEQSG
ncbi:TetR/AcrR family transcriptional regulator [Pseudofrankia sp. DC12]|uniref:TetR/AcrR family transcriptional regulator n=1 Tax=Pseudofrankia sp. DC12 TaxID=683315 RepID=UPI0009FC314F|nr:TetR/AcrR family transcriptional regulator [Pseudofrankia sp. DC12]